MADITDEEAQKLVIGVLFEVGWRKEDIEAIIQGPYVFYQRLRPPSGVVPRPYNADRIMRERLHRDTEICGHCAPKLPDVGQIHVAGLGTITERLQTPDDKER